MTDGGGLDQLAKLSGVEPEYWDIWGNLHRIDDETKVSILAALGIRANDADAVAASAAALDDADWRRILPPVAVFRIGQAVRVPITLAARLENDALTCRVIDEQGTSKSFTFVPNQMDLVGHRDMGGELMHRRLLALPFAPPMGYHDLYLGEDGGLGKGGGPRTRLIVAPEQCYLPEALAGGARQWGISTHLYSLRRDEDWGIGDFSGLTDLVDVAASLGAAIVGVNPLHALFFEHPDRASPYSPSSRLFLNPLYIDPRATADFEESGPARAVANELTEKLAAIRGKTFIDYPAVAEIKQKIFAALYKSFRDRHLARRDGGDARAEAFARFVREGGEPLRRFALFEVLSNHFDGAEWSTWPAEYRRCDASALAAFAKAHRERIEYIQYLQWQGDLQLAAAQRRARERGMSVGLYRDLAVGAASDGADAWQAQDVIITAATIGCPPDPFNMLGQDWGTPPLHPLALREQGYAAFADILRANMRHAGALRIDHVMGLMHLFWIPAGRKPDGGAYIAYPFEDMLAVLALESQRNQCLVVGEDLGTVPEGFRERMAAANVLSYRVLYFEKDGDRYKQPDEYPDLALACVTTHDLATLAGFWSEADIDLKRDLELYPDDDAESHEREARDNDRGQLLAALDRQGLLPVGRRYEIMTPTLSAAIHQYLARSPVSLLLVQIDDLTEEAEQLNLPGTDTERPNWRRRLRRGIEDVAATPLAQALSIGLRDRANADRIGN